jgi:hypothetical protein
MHELMPEHEGFSKQNIFSRKSQVPRDPAAD